MLPKTISASALKVANLCMARYKAEYVQGGRGLGGEAADLGTTCHLALEKYVQAAIVNKTSPPDLQVLLSCYMMAYLEIMTDHNFESALFKDGEKMMRVWHARNDFEGIEVLSCESKQSFNVPYKLPNGVKQEMKFNFICDRVDRISETEIRVVDYKSWRGLIQPDQVKGELQARAYALAYQIMYPNATKIWVIIDQLRGEEVGACFTRDDNIITWKSLKATLQRIIDTPADQARETLNEECRFCVRKAKCRSLRKHDEVGGLLDMTLDDLMQLHFEIKTAESTRKKLVEDVEELIKKAMDEIGLTTLDSLDGKYELNTGGTRGGFRRVDYARFPEVVGAEVALELAEYSIGKIDELRGDPRVSEETMKQIEGITMQFPGKRQVRVKRTKPKPEGDSDA